MQCGQMRERLTDILAGFTGFAAKELPDDVAARLAEMRGQETLPLANAMYDAMFKDLDMARALSRPCCQDTGILQYFVEVGEHFPCLGQLPAILREAAGRATKLAPLRPNVVELFDEKNTGTNLGTRVPWIDWDIVPDRSDVKIWLYMAGGGCSLPGAAQVFPPADGYEGAVRFVFERVSTLGVNACPPLIVGVGLAGSADVAAKLSKKALLRPIGSRNPHPRAAELEQRMERGLNAIGIGPGGLGGGASVMAVHIEQAGRHPATLAVGLSTGCWAHRRALIQIGPDLSYEILSHKGVRL